MKHNSTITTDAYKLTHWLQRPEGISEFMSYGEPRLGGEHNSVCFFGLQYILKEYFLVAVSEKNIADGYKRSLETFGYDHYFPKEIWEKVKDLGYFPIKIKAVKEGSIIPTGNVFFTIESTKPWFSNMISHFEDYLMWCWYSCGVATRVAKIKQDITPLFEKSTENPYLGFAVNDFGLRGAKFREAASIGGAAHLIFFDGSDNIPAAEFIEEYYNTSNVLKSVWATEHSVATVWGESNEKEYIKAQLRRSHPNALISVVMDSYNQEGFIPNIVSDPEILTLIRNKPGRVVFRPDSGEPLDNVLVISNQLEKYFGSTLNNKGYKVLNHNVGIIQGDGMDQYSIPNIYEQYIKCGWAAENFVTGSGGGLLDKDLTRDTDRWAIKVCHVVRNGISIPVMKSPTSDMTKSSKAGRLKLIKIGNQYKTVDEALYPKEKDYLEVVFENGFLIRNQTFNEIREIANKEIQYASF